jgi:peptide/nickel transport system substrate-binding protein
MGRWQAPVLFGALLLSGALGCRRSGEPAVVRLAQAHELYSLDPFHAADAHSRAILCNVYEGLVAFDRDLGIVPALATAWSAPDDHTWIFELRAARFHDGRPLTAADVKHSLELVAPDHTDAVVGVSAVETLGERLVRLRTLRPDPLLLNRLTQVMIVPAGMDGVSLDRRPVGTGAYRVLRRGPPLELAAFPEHWAGRPAIGRASFAAASGAEAVQGLATGDLDLYRQLPGTSLARAEALREHRVVGRPGLAMTYLWFDCTRRERVNPFADVRVRRAVSLALDREAIGSRLGSRDTPAHQLLPQGVLGFMPDWPDLPHDPALAQQLVSRAGYPDGFDTTLAHTAADRALAASVREMLEPVGIRVAAQELSWQQLLEARRDQRAGFFALSWTFDDADTWTFLMASLHSRRGPSDFRSTNAGYSNPAMDRLIEESQGALATAVLLQRYQAVLRLAMAELPIVPLYNGQDLYAVSRRLRLEPRLDGKLVLAEMSLQ